MYAIILTGGKQVKVQAGDTIFVEKLAAVEGEVVTFNQVLLVGGESLKVGTPFVANASVTGKVVKQGKSAKIVVFRYKRKSDIRIKKGHRQPFTSVVIEAING